MLYIFLGFLIVALWVLAVIKLVDIENSPAADRCNVLESYCGQFRWFSAIGRMSKIELKSLYSCNC